MYLRYIITDNFKIAIVLAKKVKNIIKLILNQYGVNICVQNLFYSYENWPVLN